MYKIFVESKKARNTSLYYKGLHVRPPFCLSVYDMVIFPIYLPFFIYKYSSLSVIELLLTNLSFIQTSHVVVISVI